MGSQFQDRMSYKQGNINMSACVYCKHKNRAATCTAFPGGIPENILRKVNDHLEPVEGDNGVVFEARDNIEELPERLRR